MCYVWYVIDGIDVEIRKFGILLVLLLCVGVVWIYGWKC